jgi:hypothetical protein
MSANKILFLVVAGIFMLDAISILLFGYSTRGFMGYEPKVPTVERETEAVHRLVISFLIITFTLYLHNKQQQRGK